MALLIFKACKSYVILSFYQFSLVYIYVYIYIYIYIYIYTRKILPRSISREKKCWRKIDFSDWCNNDWKIYYRRYQWYQWHTLNQWESDCKREEDKLKASFEIKSFWKKERSVST